jgi:hypothetical protein
MKFKPGDTVYVTNHEEVALHLVLFTKVVVKCVLEYSKALTKMKGGEYETTAGFYDESYVFATQQEAEKEGRAIVRLLLEETRKEFEKRMGKLHKLNLP